MLSLLSSLVVVSGVDLAGRQFLVQKQPDIYTHDQALEYAKKELEEILQRAQKAQNEDVSKSQYCSDHGVELKQKITTTENAIMREQAELEKLRAMFEQCGCCCNDKASLKVELLNQESDVRYQQERIENLEQQVDQLRAWCAV